MKGVHISSMYLVVVTSLLISTPIACDAEEDRGKLDEAEDGGTEEADPEAPASCDILSSVVGTYTVAGEPAENEHRGVNSQEHQRGTVVIEEDFSIDFDEQLIFAGMEISTCYDRTQQDHDRRIQVSYDSDDSGRVINVYLTEDGDVEELQFRHANEGINVRVLVSKD